MLNRLTFGNIMYGKTLNAGGELGGDPVIDVISIILVLAIILVPMVIITLRRHRRSGRHDH